MNISYILPYNHKYKVFLHILHQSESANTYVVHPVLKVSYLILAIYITLTSFELIGNSFMAFVLTLVFGNIILRVIYELSLVLLTICRNTTEINKKLK